MRLVRYGATVAIRVAVLTSVLVRRPADHRAANTPAGHGDGHGRVSVTGKDAPMASSLPPRQLLAVDPICAVCDTEVTVIQGAPSRQKVSAGSSLYRTFAWCRLLPCGHTFTVRAGSLIH
jgi:hypothetical protein